MVPKAVGSIPITRPKFKIKCYNLFIRGCRIVANIPAFQASDESSILSTRTKISFLIND